MGQQEDFRTPGGAGNGARDGVSAPLFDDRSAQRAAPVVPLERVARRERFKHLAGRWRAVSRTPQFHRTWPLALLVLATLAAAAVAAANFYSRGDATRAAAPLTAAATVESDDDATGANDDMEQPAARGEINDSRGVGKARGGGAAAADEKPAGNSEVFAAAALGNLLGSADDPNGERDEAAAAGGGERDKGKRQKRAKRRQGAARARGGAILFDVIR